MKKQDKQQAANPPAAKPGHGGHQDGHHGGLGSEPSFAFTFSEDLATVLTFSTTTRSGATLSLDVTGLSTTVGTNDLGASSVIAVTRTQSDGNANRFQVWQDQDGDTAFLQSHQFQVAKVANASLEKHKFTFDAAGAITQDSEQVQTRWGASTTWKVDPISAKEVYQKVTLDSKVYVVKTELSGPAASPNYHFEVYRDDNADNIWTEVARGDSHGALITAATGALDLSQIQAQLAASAAVVG